jgi:phage terminase small subunit
MKKAVAMPAPYPDPPSHLSERSKEIWGQIGPKHAREVGRQILLQHALECLDRCDQARKAIADEGLTSITARSGVAHVHPMARVESEARKMLAKLFFQLGIDQVPSSIWG